MKITFDDYLKKIKNLSSEELEFQTIKTTRNEKENVAKTIAHIAEIKQRNLHLDLGYKSLFEYCLKVLRLDEGQIWLRTQVANVCQKHPDMLDLISLGKISLSVAGKLSPHITEENCEKFLKNCVGMTKMEAEEYIARLNPEKKRASSIRKAAVKPLFIAPTSPDEGPLGLTLQKEIFGVSTQSSKKEQSAKTLPEPTIHYNFNFAASKDFKEKLDRLGEVLGVVDIKGNLEKILDYALESALNKKDPKRKEDRKKTAKEKLLKKKNSPASKKKRSRYIPAKLRAETLKRAGYQCEFVSDREIRCHCKTGLHLDHVVPFAKGGGHEINNLQVLCPEHNLRKASLDFGEEYIKKKISAGRGHS